jgi:hypothetical protein
VEKYCRAGQVTDEIWRMRTACWIPKAADRHSEYIILVAFPGQQWLHERVAMLRYTYMPVLLICVPFRSYVFARFMSSAAQVRQFLRHVCYAGSVHTILILFHTSGQS